MNNRPTRPKYRRSIYKKRRLKTVIITSVVLLVAVFIAFLVIGNILNDKVNGYNEPNDTPDADVIPDENTHSMLELRSHYAIPSSAYSVMRDVSDLGGNAVGIALTDSTGLPLYRSDVATSLGVEYSASTTISDIVSSAEYFDVHACGIIYCNIFTSTDENLRAAKLGYFVALAAEALDEGLDKVLVAVHDAEEENLPELIAMANELQRLGVSNDIGFSLPLSFYTADDSSYNIELLWNEVDFLGVDLTSLTPLEDQDMGDAINDALSNNLVYFIKSHGVRVLIPTVEDETINEKILTSLRSHDVGNYQYIG